MAVVIRLQGLPGFASSADIRRFFSGLNILDGGVHIIGGAKGEAFIIFATDEDARQGMSFSGRFFKDSRIELFLSSKTEMQNIMEVNRKRFDHGGRETVSGSRRAGSGVGNLSNVVAGIKKGIGKPNYGSPQHLEDDFHSSGSQNNDVEVSESTPDQSKKEPFNFDNLYVFVRGMPFSASEDDVFNFFSGLEVEKVIFIKYGGRPNGNAVVKFTTPSEAKKGLLCSWNYMGSRYVEVRPCDKGTSVKFSVQRDKKYRSFAPFAQLNQESSSSSEHCSRRESSYMPSRKPSSSKSPLGRFLARSHSVSPPRFLARSRSRSPVAHSSSEYLQWTAAAHSPSPLSHSRLSHSSDSREFYVHVKNLSPAIEKRDLRVFFGALDIPSHHIMLLEQDHNYEKTREAFVLFTSFGEYETALSYHKKCLFAKKVHVSPTSKRTILQIAESSRSKKNMRKVSSP